MAQEAAPTDLGPGGNRLWQTMTQAHDLTRDDLARLEDVARRWDTLDGVAAGDEAGHRGGQYGKERHPGLI
jgi:phage FluMu protein gp41